MDPLDAPRQADAPGPPPAQEPSDPWEVALTSVLHRLPRDLPTLCVDAGAAERVVAAGGRATVASPEDVEPGTVAAVALLDDELTAAGEDAEQLLARATSVVRPAGALVATVRAGEPQRPVRGVPAARESPAPAPGPRTFTPRDVEHLLLHRGLAVERLEQHRDRLLVVARAPVGEAERSSRFVASLPFKLVTAAVLCRDATGRLLCVFDTFKRHWTIPGGVVDAGEDPRTAAVREAYEEGGVRVRAGDLLGVFSTAWPDRLLCVYAAAPVDPDDPAVAAPVTRHPHEIGEVAWLPVQEALARVSPGTRWQVERCLESPGETWRE